jgi:hypothetical protein
LNSGESCPQGFFCGRNNNEVYVVWHQAIGPAYKVGFDERLFLPAGDTGGNPTPERMSSAFGSRAASRDAGCSEQPGMLGGAWSRLSDWDAIAFVHFLFFCKSFSAGTSVYPGLRFRGLFQPSASGTNSERREKQLQKQRKSYAGWGAWSDRSLLTPRTIRRISQPEEMRQKF